CQQLRNHDVDLAIAGGITIYSHPGMLLSMRNAGMLSPTGVCRPFDHAADGIVVGDGIGIVILKRLQDAERDADPIYGVIQASGTNQDGQTKGLTVPSFQSQSQLQETIYRKHRIDPCDIQYVEAHGTGTKLGDPIEIHALTHAFNKFTSKKRFCAIGSLKANIGHAGAAAGVLGLIKVLVSLKQKQIPPSIHLSRENEHIDFANSPVYVNTALKPWPLNANGSRMAAISSFGFSGTNAHLVISEYVAKDQRAGASPYPSVQIKINEATPGVLILSAECQEGLYLYARKIRAFLQKHGEINLADLLYTFQVGRESKSYRLAFVVTSKEMLLEQLEQLVAGDDTTYLKRCVRKITKQENFIGDTEEGQEFIQKLVQNKRLEKLAELWLSGNPIPWEGLYPQGSVKRLAGLPTFPFAKEHYEISQIDLLHGFGSRPFSPQEETQTRLLIPSWVDVAIPRQSLEDPAPIRASSLVLLCDLPSILPSHLQAQMPPGGRCRSLSSSQSHRGLRFQDAVIQLIQELQHLQQSKPAGPVLVQLVVADSEQPYSLSALAAVLRVAQQEYPKLRGQLIEVEGLPEEGELLVTLRKNQRRSQESHIRYSCGKRWVRGWQEHHDVTPPAKIPWKEGGCYLITGGAGGLARLLVQEIARQVETASVILCGRSVLSREQCMQLEQETSSGIRIDYQQVDVSDGPAVHALIERVVQQSGHLDGIIHAAGLIHNARFFDKTPEEIQAVLSPKVMGVEHLDEVSRGLPLDFFILCSSLSAVLGSIGFIDYAAANAYLDAFAHARQALVLSGERQGETLSINWPYWEAGGMQTDVSTIQMMRDLVGEEPMGTETGIRTLYQALAWRQAQVVVLHGQVERIKQQLLCCSPDLPIGVGLAPPSPVESTTDPGQKGGQERSLVPMDRLRQILTHLVSNILKVRVEEIDSTIPLTEYGCDSITFTQLANRLNQTYQLNLTPPLFFELSTIELLAQHLQANYAHILAPHFALASPLAARVTQKDFTPPLVKTEEVSPVAPVVRRRPLLARSLIQGSEQQIPTATSPIAIIGMSGLFPQAPDVQSFWHNLLEGKDCIGEIPASRWDWQTSFGHPETSVNATNIKWAGVIEGVEMFDPLFFGISPREAEQMDPQQRLLMMYVWRAIEDAGYSAESLSGTDTAVFVGTASSGYAELLSRASVAIEGYSATGLAPSVGPNRVSYFLNLHGPSELIDTACSSSL
ncbi:MAG: SDR family NAD(P)-dependent oxidoreductase, partial [Chloroflexi bacterium]